MSELVKLLSHLTDYLSSNNLLNTFQSAYTKSRSTETILAVHNHITKAMGQQQVTAVCLLDVSSAFDNIDHYILPSPRNQVSQSIQNDLVD